MGPISVESAKQFWEALWSAITLINQGKRRKAVAMKTIADKKFLELEETHTLFVQLIAKMATAARSFRERLARTDDIDAVEKELADELDNISKIRNARREQRQAQY